jgi:hypothetical protein
MEKKANDLRSTMYIHRVSCHRTYGDAVQHECAIIHSPAQVLVCAQVMQYTAGC